MENESPVKQWSHLHKILYRLRERRHKPLPNNAFYPLEPHIQNFIRQALSTHSSPEIISGRLHLEFGI
ncbi:hypothetical protein [Symbiopectobacterium purcellii]|uniref:hypothetical protein n=1 Tax=Symbiopectobacterium purcellii TaxID=2871826 RepID=UPI003F850362